MIELLAALTLACQSKPGPTMELIRKVEVTLKTKATLSDLSADLVSLGHWTKDRNGFVVRLKSSKGLETAVIALRRSPSVLQAEPMVELPSGISTIGRTSVLETLVADLRRAQVEVQRLEKEQVRKPGEVEEEEIPGLDFLGALLQYQQQRAFPKDTIDWQAWPKAAEHRDNMPIADSGNSITDVPSTTWKFCGPTNLDTPYRTYWGLPPVVGRVNAVAVHPTDPHTIFAGGAGGGLMKSTDSGVTWTSLSDSWSTLQVSCIAIDPANPLRIFVGTGDFHGFGGYGTGIMRSLDGGATWSNVGRATLGNFAVSDILIDPENPNLITASTGRGRDYWSLLYRSSNGGSSWSVVINSYAPWCDLAMSAASGGTRYYYAVGGGNGGQIWRSDNRGQTWTQLTPGLSGNFQDSLAIACSPTNPEVVYLMSPTDRIVLKSTNHGATWTNITGNIPTGNNWTQGWYDYHLTCSTKTGGIDVLYAGLIDLQMDDGGDGSWQSVGGPTYSGSALTHNDQHCMTVSPSNSNVSYVGNDGGLYRFTYNPAAGTYTWNYLSANLGITQFYSLATHPTDKDRMLGGTQDNASPWSQGTLANWDNVAGGDGIGVALIKNAPNTMYAGSQYYGQDANGNIYLYRTANAWANVTYPSVNTSGQDVLFIPPMASDPNSTSVYIGTDYLHRYTGSTWNAKLGNQVLAATGAISAISVAPSNGQRIYTGSSEGEVWKTSNNGTSWTQINTGTPSLPARYITCLSVDPGAPANILVGVSGTGSGHLFQCANTDAGARVWTDVSGSGNTGLPDIPLNGIARDPDAPATTWYVATDVGVFMTTNAGATWLSLTGQVMGLPNVQCNALTAEAGTRFLTVATFGRGIWRIGLPFNLCPATATLIEGFTISGGLGDLCVADDAYWNIFPSESSLKAVFEVTATSLIANISQLTLAIESSVARPGLSIGVEFYRYTTSSFITQGGGAATTTDTTLSSTVSVSASNYVNATNRQVRARITFAPINDEDPSQDGWSHFIDQVKWTVNP